LLQFNKYFEALLKTSGINIKHTYYCPHTKEGNCICRKPKPYFLRKAEQDHHVSLRSSFVVGDHPHDIEMAHIVRATSVYVLSGHGKKHKEELQIKPDFIANDLYEAAFWIVRKTQTRAIL